MIRLDDANPFRAIVFDVDGTLYDGAGLRRRMLAELLLHCARDPRHFPILRTLQVYRQEREKLATEEVQGVARLQYERPALRLGLSAATVESRVFPWIHERPLRHLSNYLIPGISKFFNRIRASESLIAVLSDYPATAKLSAMGLEVDRVRCGTDPEIDRLKPHPAGLQTLLDELGLEPRQCLLIGDRDDRDGEAARRVGMPFRLRRARPRSDLEFRDFLQLEGRLSWP